MPVFEQRSTMPVSREALWQYHANPGALERLIPPWQPTRILENEGPMRDGKRVVLSMKIGPIWKRWVAEHFDVATGERFRDRQTRGPFAAWTHTHRFSNGSAGDRSELLDHVDYKLPLGPVGAIGDGHIRRELARMFAFRHARTRNDLRLHDRLADTPRQRIAISGARGLIGRHLAPSLTTAGHTVARLVRTHLRERSPNPDEIGWDSYAASVDEDRLAECDAIVHLAGENIAQRWTRRRQAIIRASRVEATRGLCEALGRMERRPRVLVCASAVGFYGDRGEELLDEFSPPGRGFTAETCAAWEAATVPARDAGIRVVNVRIGVVLSAAGGALRKMLPPAKLGLAGRVGSGRQFMPWIAMDDLIAVLHEVLFRHEWSGPINAVTASVRQQEFITTLGRVLKRPTFMPLPAMAVRRLFGEMGQELLLASANVQPARLREAGFEWMLPDLENALRFELGRMSAS